jgi:molecular chaperone GrpE
MLTEENKSPLDEVIDNITGESNSTHEETSENVLISGVDELSKLNTELAEQKDKFIRLYAEFDNFKRRTSKERLDLIKTAGQDLIVEMLSVVDDFDRAQKLALESGKSELYPEGLSLIHHKLVNILSQRGLKSMESTGKDFDPESHEAIAEIPAASEDLKSKVIDTVEKGYYLSEKIIRFAKVVVGK